MRLLHSPLYERYFARQIYWAFGFALFAFAGLFLSFDLINELNRIGQSHYRWVYAAARMALLAPMRVDGRDLCICNDGRACRVRHLASVRSVRAARILDIGQNRAAIGSDRRFNR